MAPNHDDADKYGYEDPDAVASERNRQQYGYGDETSHRTPRRSSMKQEGGHGRRRASIQITGSIDVYLPGRDGPVTRRTSIEFSEKSDTHTIHTARDPSDSWMRPEEYDKISKDNSKIVRAIEKGTDKHFCVRGLEGMMHRDEEERVRKEAYQEVLDEQSTQREDGRFDEDKISERYRYVGLQPRLDAAERAEQDNADIEGYMKSTRRMLRRGSC